MAKSAKRPTYIVRLDKNSQDSHPSFGQDFRYTQYVSGAQFKAKSSRKQEMSIVKRFYFNCLVEV